MDAAPTGTLTFVFSDVEGSTRLWAEHPEEMKGALARHDAIVEELAAARGGYVFATAGDSYGVAFVRPGSAAAFALDVQAAVGAEPWPPGVELRVRIGMHTGEADERGGDFYGPAVNLAARIEAAGHGGQTLTSAVTAALLDGHELTEIGTHRLKGVVEAQRILQFGRAAFRPLRTESSGLGNLPRQLDRLIGREAPLSDVAAALTEAAITTLVGPGGIGKTRLAVEAARRAAGAFDAVWIVELASIGEPDDVDRAVADVIGAKEAAGSSLVDAIAQRIAERRWLVVVDNCEHVVDGVADLVGELCDRCPSLAVLATSREGLAVTGERIVVLGPLDESGPAVELFVERARSADHEFDPDDDPDSIREVCRRLDGVPLAIELAAARVRTLPPADLAARLDDQFRLLTAGRRSRIERHRTLRATVEWSFDLLEPDERTVFQRLSVFAGWFDLAAAEAVAGGDLSDSEVADLVGDLVDRSMVLSEPGTFGRRFRLLETMRQFGAERLRDAGDTDRVARRHAEWYADYSQRLGRLLEGPGELEGVARVDEAWGNLRAANGWSADAGDVDLVFRITAPLSMELYLRGRIELGDWSERLLGLPGAKDHPLFVQALNGAAGRYWWTDDRAAFDRLYERYGDGGHANVAMHRANLDRDWERVLEVADAAFELNRSLGFEYAAKWTWFGARNALMFLGRMEEYEADLRRFLADDGPRGAPTLASVSHHGLAIALTVRGVTDEARHHFEAAAGYELPPRTFSLGGIVAAVNAIDSGRPEDAAAALVAATSPMIDAENTMLANYASRVFAILMARMDRPREVATMLGFYDKGNVSGPLAAMVTEPRAYLAARATPELDAIADRGRAMSGMDALRYMHDVCSRLGD